ncbi:MAG: lantibiotic dehydratase, partial [Bacteroidetes bacterium]|nr:lantibiotic dehydratase [Bacteroidota bacterium]
MKKGLLLSSKTFLDALTIYQKNLPNSFGKKEEQIELTLLKYVARIHAKTSPFSTFTNLSIGRLADLDKVFFKLSDKNYFGEKVKSHIRLNNVLLKLLLKVFRREKSIYLNTYLKLNPTVSSNSLSYRFLINKDNIESFQEIKTNSVVQLVYSKLISLKGGIRFKDLITDCLNHIEGDFNKIEEYIYKL